MNEGPCLACGELTSVVRVPYPERSRIERPDGTPVFLCDDCRSSVEAGEYGAFSNGSLLRLREWAPLFGLDVAEGRDHPNAGVVRH
jgi:hypothetical protein